MRERAPSTAASRWWLSTARAGACLGKPLAAAWTDTAFGREVAAASFGVAARRRHSSVAILRAKCPTSADAAFSTRGLSARCRCAAVFAAALEGELSACVQPRGSRARRQARAAACAHRAAGQLALALVEGCVAGILRRRLFGRRRRLRQRGAWVVAAARRNGEQWRRGCRQRLPQAVPRVPTLPLPVVVSRAAHLLVGARLRPRPPVQRSRQLVPVRFRADAAPLLAPATPRAPGTAALSRGLAGGARRRAV
mmetsp:Transcript_35156/g.113380  ORF Transcript_35156/g.113380 Transcript_35156/m.113380 type:complete len:253 (-) Transcript_35156:119-877(-)